MGKVKKLLTVILAVVMVMGFAITAQAASHNFVPSDRHCINSGCGYAPLWQDKNNPNHWYCIGCGWDYYNN